MLIPILLGAGAFFAVYGEIYATWASRRFPADGDFIDWEGEKLHVRRLGRSSANSVMLVHGASANGREFLTNLAPALASQFNLLIPDRLGAGHSTRPSNGHELAVQAKAMAHVLERSAEAPVVLVGHSFGGAVSLRIALDYPDLVKGVVLLAPASHPWSGKTGLPNRLAANPFHGPAFSRIAPIAGPLLAANGIQNVFAPEPAPDDYQQNLGLPLLFRPRNFRANAQDMSAANAEFKRQSERYGEITKPIIIYSPAKDHVLSPKLHARALSKALPHAEIVKIPDAGHMPHHFHVEKIVESVKKLSEVENLS